MLIDKSATKESRYFELKESMSSTRKVIHIDMDAFYASVEQRDDPKLRGQAVVVGGKPKGRGVVAACSYEARKFGIHSAMPSAEAYRRCPKAIFVKPRFDTYKLASKQIHAIFEDFTEQIEPLSLDEAYLDVTDSPYFNGSAIKLAKEIKAQILQQTGLIASAGVSYNKLLAKLASDFDKPNGLYCVLPGQGEAFVSRLPVGKIHGVGKVTESKMHDLGIVYGSDLKLWTEEELVSEFGKSGSYLYNSVRGIDHRPVKLHRVRKSLGSERTFGENLVEVESMRQFLLEIAQANFSQMKQKQLAARSFSIKVRFADFSTFTRSYSATDSQLDLDQVERAIPFLLAKALASRSGESHKRNRFSNDSNVEGVRLLGVTFRGLHFADEKAPRQLQIQGLS